MGKAKKPTGSVQITIPDGFGRAAEKLADTIHHVVDLAMGPDRIRAKIIAEAEGQAAAMVIFAEGRAKVQGVEARAVARLRKREVRRQENIESITKKAFDALPPPVQVSEQPVNQDWTSRFFQECQDISDEQMQQIWARILAGEVARPGSFAPRTLSIVRDLTKEDADLFAKVCSFTWDIPGTGIIPVIHMVDGLVDGLVDGQQSAKAELNIGMLMHLTSIGLIEFNVVTEYGTVETRTEIAPSYYSRGHQLKSDGGVRRSLSLGHVVFTSAGAELARISNAVGNDQHEKAALDKWSTKGWKEATDVAETQQLGPSKPPQMDCEGQVHGPLV